MNLIRLLLIVSLVLSGCRPAARLIYGVKEPDFMESEQLYRKSFEIFGDTVPVFIYSFESWHTGRPRHVPDIFVFDRYGRYIPYRDPQFPNCNGPAGQFLFELDTSANYYYSDELNMETFISGLERPGCVSIEILQNGEADFYIFFTWLSWMGMKIYREKTLDWIGQLRNNKKINVQVFSVSMDLASCWPDEQKQKIGEK